MQKTNTFTHGIDVRTPDDSNTSSNIAGSPWENLAYGAGTFLLAAGPVLAGVDMMEWMTIFLGINVAILMIACLLAIWKNLTGTLPTSRRK